MKRLIGVTLHYEDGSGTFIDKRVIETMKEAAESIEMLNEAKETAKRLIEVAE